MDILEDVVPTEDLKKCEEIYYRELESHEATTQSTFQYACCLVRSKYATDIRKGLCLLENLFVTGSEVEKRDYVYYIAVGHAKLKDYKKSLEYVRVFLSLEPGNTQVQHLEATIKERMKKDGLAGIALAGGGALVVGAVLALAMAVAKK